MNIRTDLAVELRGLHPQKEIFGIKSSDFENSDCKANIIEITNEKGAEKLGKPIGKYITLEMESFPDTATLFDGRFSLLCEMLSLVLPENGDVLIAGLGNPDITPDRIGPLCCNCVLATRHIPQETKEQLKLPELRNVSVVCPGVTGKTGIETVEIIAGIKEKINPAVIILIDALAARSVSRLGTTIQICDTGISPGSGVGNRRLAINPETMKTPVVAIGIPTVVDAATLSYDLTGKEPEGEFQNMMVTPKDTDIITSGGARLISLAINYVLQKNLSKEEIISLTMP